jgi:hypothetical protein
MNSLIINSFIKKNTLIPPSGNERIKGKRESQIVSIVGKKKDAVTLIEQSLYNRLNAQKVEQLIVRINNLKFCLSQLAQFKTLLKQKAQDIGNIP